MNSYIAPFHIWLLVAKPFWNVTREYKPALAIAISEVI